MFLLIISELYATEAIALYDYKGRSDKELSFKKGDWLSIRGQLSADWWQGCLASCQSTNRPDKYIPDKYIALRSSKRKCSANTTQNSLLIQSMTTPSSISNQTPDRMSISMTQKSLLSTPTSSINQNRNFSCKSINSSNQMLREALLPNGNNNMTCSQLTSESDSLNDLIQAKESDIIDNEDTQSVISEAVSMILNNNSDNLRQQNYMALTNQLPNRNSPSNSSIISSSYTSNNHSLKHSSEIQRRVSLKKQRNLSASSSVSFTIFFLLLTMLILWTIKLFT